MAKRKKVVAEKPKVFIKSEFDSTRAQTRKFLARLNEAEKLISKHRTVFECVKELREGFKFYVINNCGGLLVIAGIRVKAMKDVQPVLELLEKHMKISFDSTTDHGEMKWRMFSSKQLPWFRVDAEIADDSVSCKQVVVGYEQTPKYELRCDEAQAA